METVVVEMDERIRECEVLERRVMLRLMSDDEWINCCGSGTLRKNKNIGMSWKSQYIAERTCYEFGWEFEILPRSRITFGDAITEGDEKAITEAGWHIERYMRMMIFPEDRVECKFIVAEYPDGKRREGIGMIVRETSAWWIPRGHIIFAIVAEFDKVRNCWKEAVNPF